MAGTGRTDLDSAIYTYTQQVVAQGGLRGEDGDIWTRKQGAVATFSVFRRLHLLICLPRKILGPNLENKGGRGSWKRRPEGEREVVYKDFLI